MLLLCVLQVLSPEEQTMAASNDYNFDHPGAFDFELLVATLRKLKQGKSVKIPVYDFTTHKRQKDWVNAQSLRDSLFYVDFPSGGVSVYVCKHANDLKIIMRLYIYITDFCVPMVSIYFLRVPSLKPPSIGGVVNYTTSLHLTDKFQEHPPSV